MRAAVTLACLGEPLICFSAPSIGDADNVHVGEGGAEFNVAVHLARLGMPVRFLGAVGDDVLGRRLVARLQREGVDVSGLQLRPGEHTGAYVKEWSTAGREVVYLRAGSAASRLELDRRALGDVEHLHLSGITAALSEHCAALLADLLARPRRWTASFDVNHRDKLWSAERAAQPLAGLAAAADLVFVGRDEAELLWGTTDVAAIRARFPEPVELVVTDGAAGATAWRGADRVSLAPPAIAVVEAVGAGDAFAAGYLYGRRRGHPPAAALAAGHRMAAGPLQAGDDLGPPVAAYELDRLLEGCR